MDKVNSNKILVTGATGYIGGSLCNGLEELGFDITRGSRSPPLKHNSAHKWVSTDWNDENLSFLSEFDCVVHAAGPTSRECVDNPKLAKYFYGDVTARLIEILVKQGGKSVFLISSVHVYSTDGSGVITEETYPSNTHPYVAHRQQSGDLLISHLENNQIDGCILRLGNCFGKIGDARGDFGNLFVNQICRDVLNTGRININSNPSVRRDFVPISYLIRVVRELLMENLKFAVYNVVTGSSMSLLEVATEVAWCSKKLTNNIPEIGYDQDLIQSVKVKEIDNSRCSSLVKIGEKEFTTAIIELLS